MVREGKGVNGEKRSGTAIGELTGSGKEGVAPGEEEEEDDGEERDRSGHRKRNRKVEGDRIGVSSVHGIEHGLYDLTKTSAIGGREGKKDVENAEALKADGRVKAPRFELEHGVRGSCLESHPSDEDQDGGGPVRKTPRKQNGKRMAG